MRMAASQFVKDFRRSCQLKKSSEHRKRVLQRQQAATVRNDAISFMQIVADQSTGKRASHCGLVAFTHKHGLTGIQRVYMKEQLTRLCRAYGVRVRTMHTKLQLANHLVKAITSCETNYIPCHLSLSEGLRT